MEELVKGPVVFITATKLEDGSLDSLLKHAKASRYKFIIQREYGSGGTNPHLHMLVMGGAKRTDNFRTTIKSWIYPEAIKAGEVIDQVRMTVQNVTGLHPFLHYCNYMLKESSDYIYASDGLPNATSLQAKYCEFEEEVKKTMAQYADRTARSRNITTSTGRYECLCDEYNIDLRDYVGLFNALRGDGRDVCWLIKDKRLIKEYISLRTSDEVFNRIRFYQEMYDEGLLDKKGIEKLKEMVIDAKDRLSQKHKTSLEDFLGRYYKLTDGC